VNGSRDDGDVPNVQRQIPFARASIDEDDISAVVDVLRSGWITTGPKVREFEAVFADRIGSDQAIALNSATAVLHLALDAVGLQPGDAQCIPYGHFTDKVAVRCTPDASSASTVTDVLGA
jgi:dTDP-4-amino-4,6-dideoxygalactose transaminase